MKKMHLILALTLFFLMAVLPRQIQAFKGNMGIKLGFSSGQLRAEEGEQGFEVEKFSLSGVCAGLLANFDLTKFLCLQPEIQYFEKGGKYNVQVPIDIPGISVSVKDKRSLKYVEIPLLLKFLIPLRGSFRPTFLIGPSMGINLKGKLERSIKIQVPGFSFSLDETQDLKKELNDIEFSFVIGGGFDWNLLGGKLVADNRFFFGLMHNKYKVVVPASKFAALGFPMAQDASYDLNMYNYVFSVSIGYLF